MRLPWQCPTCYAELGDRSYAKMLTCPYCGSLLIVEREKRKFLRVPKDSLWHYFPKGEEGLVIYGEHSERYLHLDHWLLVKDGNVYRMVGETNEEGEKVDEGEVVYLWGEFPFVAPPGSKISTEKIEGGLIKVYPRERVLFLQIKEEIPDSVVKLL